MSENIFELTPLEEFQMEFERYFPDFYDALINDTLDTDAELRAIRETMKVAILYALGYLFEHREEADHHELTLTLRSLLFGIREGEYF